MKEDEKQYQIYQEKDGTFVVEGPAADKLMGSVNIEDNESMYYFQKRLKDLGIEDELKEMGIKVGDTVRIADWELEWYE